MSNWNGNKGKQSERPSEAATKVALKQGDFTLGSMESRAAARAIIEAKKKIGKTIRVVFIGTDGKEISHRLIKLESS